VTAATLFSGIGAPETAMPEWAWLWSAEIEAFPSAVLAARHGALINLGDVRAEGFCDRAVAIGRPDVVIFGSPCQSFSVAGQRLGLDDARGNLALEALRILRILRPAWFVFENVPGLLSSADGRDFGLFLRTVDELGCALAWSVLDAQYFGVAQRRRRVFAVGHFGGDWRGPAAVLFESESVCGDPPARGQTGQDVTGTVGARAGSRGGTDFEAGTLGGASQSGGFRTPDLDNSGAFVVSHALRAELAPTLRAGAEVEGHANGGVMPAIAYVADDYRRGTYEAAAAAAPLTTSADRSRSAPVVAEPYAIKVRGRDGGRDLEARQDGTANALRTPSGGRDGFGNGAIGGEASGVRRLTPRECERLQGFPDDYTRVLYRGKWAKDGPRYKAIGNSMAVPVIRWILRRLAEVDRLMAARS